MNIRADFIGRLCSVLVLGGFTHSGLCVDYPKEGPIDVNFCFAAEGPRFQPTASLTYGQQMLHAASFSSTQTGGPFDHYGSVCVLVYVQNPGGKSGANGHCENTDKDGHKWVYTFLDVGNQMSGTWEFIGGTGKYEGARMSGDFLPSGPLFFGAPGHVQRCMKVRGAYKLR